MQHGCGSDSRVAGQGAGGSDGQERVGQGVALGMKAGVLGKVLQGGDLRESLAQDPHPVEKVQKHGQVTVKAFQEFRTDALRWDSLQKVS